MRPFTKVLLVAVAVSSVGLGLWVMLSAHQRIQGRQKPPSLPAAPTVAHSVGGFLVRLRHSGRQSRQDERSAMGIPATFDISGVVTREFDIAADTAELPVVSVWGYALDGRGVAEPKRALDLTAQDGTRWRLEVLVLVEARDLTPSLRSLVGAKIRLRVSSVIFGVTRFETLRVWDAYGLVLALDFRLLDQLDDPDLCVSTGAHLGAIKNGCGTFTTKELAFTANSQLSLGPGHSGTLRVREHDYEVQNLASTFVTEYGRCTDMVDDVAWLVQRLPKSD